MRPAPDGGSRPYCTDAGCFLVAEQFGCKAMVYVKGEDGLCTANPRTDKAATLIPKNITSAIGRLVNSPETSNAP